MTAARIAATTSPCPAAANGFCRPKRLSINRRPLCFRREAVVARRAEFHRRRQARQDKYGRQDQQQQAAHDRAQTRVPLASRPQAALHRQRTDGRVPEPDRQREGNHADPGKHGMMRRQQQRGSRRGVLFPDVRQSAGIVGRHDGKYGPADGHDQELHRAAPGPGHRTADHSGERRKHGDPRHAGEENPRDAVGRAQRHVETGFRQHPSTHIQGRNQHAQHKKEDREQGKQASRRRTIAAFEKLGRAGYLLRTK